MDMARHRKPKTLSLDPDVVERAELWLRAQVGKPSLSALIDDALTQLLDKLEEDGSATRQAAPARKPSKE